MTGYKHFILSLCVVASTPSMHSQTNEFHGQAVGWLLGNQQAPSQSQIGLRYIPDFLAERTIAGGWSTNAELSVNTFGTATIAKDRSISYESTFKLYRAWLRGSTDRFELRVGLQKINFGSALLFRPLMWFDRIDPRDPLQLTDGVSGALARYTFQNNANVWLWGLYGNDKTKGWEVVPTEKNSVEYGGRVQSPVWDGELGLTYHHRRADTQSIIRPAFDISSPVFPEDRFGLDGKWDLGIGVWFESALFRQEVLPSKFGSQFLWTLGADYTIPVGNGLYLATEYFRIQHWGEGQAPQDDLGFSGVSANYPIGILDQVSAIVYRDWMNQQWYRIVTWQRTYDNWSFYVLGFWNPETIQIYQTQGSTNAFAGTGFQVMVVFNH